RLWHRNPHRNHRSNSRMTSRFKPGRAIQVAQTLLDIDNRSLAKKLGCHEMTVCRMRLADDIKINRLAEVADAFGMSLMELLSLGDNNESEGSGASVP
ncbi:MAG: hypothetical protein ACO2ZE_10695, partial [Pseudohongiellaceae bacterium]